MLFIGMNQMVLGTFKNILGQVLAKNETHAHIWAYIFWPLLSHYFSNWAEKLFLQK